MKNSSAFTLLTLGGALLVSGCSETPYRASPAPVYAPVNSAPRQSNNEAATMVSYACNVHKNIAVTYRDGGSDQTAKMVLEGKVLMLTRVNSPSGLLEYVSEPYFMQVANSGDLRQSGMTVFKRQANNPAKASVVLEDCRPK